jgi:hypothetical protein
MARLLGSLRLIYSKVLTLIAGIGGGWAFYYVWRKILPRTRSRVFWQAVPVHASGMLHSADPDDVVRHYGALIKHAANFAARNTLAIFAGLLPAVGLFLLSGELYLHERRASVVEVWPAIAVAGIPGSILVGRTEEGGLLIDRREIRGRELRLLGETLDSDALAEKRAFCTGTLACLGYAVMLFETHRLQAELPGKNAKSVVVRPRAFAANPFWPYVDDLELVFFGGLIAGGIAAGWRSYRKRVTPS